MGGRRLHPRGRDSIMYPGTIAFERFEYPSSLPEPVQQRMGGIARRLMRGIGYQDGMFNIEFMYDPETEAIRIIRDHQQRG